MELLEQLNREVAPVLQEDEKAAHPLIEFRGRLENKASHILWTVRGNIFDNHH
jgi:hypothetical protein